MPRSVDAHFHVWDATVNRYPYLTDGSRDRMHGKPLPRRWVMEDYLRVIAGQGIIRSVHIQCGWDPVDPVGETRWLDEIADRFGHPHGIVAHADLAAGNVEEMLAAHCEASTRTRGIRQHVGWHDSPRYRLAARPDMLKDPAWINGYRTLAQFGLSFDLQAFFPQFEDAARLARAVPDVPLILCNAGMPVDRDEESVEGWRRCIRKLAEAPNSWAKIGGFGMVDHDWTTETIRPFVMWLIECFGTERCLFGSNFPVDGLFRSFGFTWRAFREILADFSATERDALLYGNACRVYRLTAASPHN